MRPGSDMSLFKVTLHIGLKRARKKVEFIYIYIGPQNTKKHHAAYLLYFSYLLTFKYFVYNVVTCLLLHLVPVQYEGVKCLSLEMEEGGRDRGRERKAAELIAPRHLFQPMLKNYSTVPPDTAFYPQKDHC